LAFVISEPRKGFSFLLQGQKKLIELGDYWVGRPHIHLFSFDEQKNSAYENDQAFNKDFASIIMRTPRRVFSIHNSYTPKNYREFDDYCVYISQTSSLWVWSIEGLNQQEKWKDPNNGCLIYEHQAIIELLEYGYMLHRSLLERVNSLADSRGVLEFRKTIIELEQQLSESSPYGEIRDLLQKGWREYGIEDIKKRNNELLKIIETEKSFQESKYFQTIGIVISVFFGIIAIPATSDKFLIPLWNILNLWKPQNRNLFELYFSFISSGLVFIFILLLFMAVGKSTEKN